MLNSLSEDQRRKVEGPLGDRMREMHPYCKESEKNLSNNRPSSADMIQRQGQSIHNLNSLQMKLIKYQNATDFQLKAIELARDVIRTYEEIQARISPQGYRRAGRELLQNLDSLKREVELGQSRGRHLGEILQHMTAIVSKRNDHYKSMEENTGGFVVPFIRDGNEANAPLPPSFQPD
jgi:hypothetical protein